MRARGKMHSALSWTRWRVILVALAIMSAALRLPGLNAPTDAGTPVFDEKHYVPQAWQILRGYSGLLIGGIEDNPGFGLVVHPPLAKQLQSLGMAVFGYSPFGWRVSTALLSILTIVLIAAIARRISRSDWVGLLAGILALSEGILFVTGRSGMLDHTQTLFVVAAAYCAVRDHEQMETRFTTVLRERRMFLFPLGPRMGFRWWRFAMGIALGLSLAVKWSGLYYLAFAGVALVVSDFARRRRFGVFQPFKGTLLLDSVSAFASVVILPVSIYFATFRAWFANDSSVYRHALESGQAKDFAIGPLVNFLPQSVENFIYYHYSVLKFHTELTNSAGHIHPWESKPWSWLVSSRGLMYYNPGANSEGIRHVVLLLGTPAIWWPCVPVLLWGLWCLIIRRDGRWAIPVVGFATGFLPWLLAMDRQMYLFYAVNLAPFLVIALALALGQLSTWRLASAEEPASQYQAVTLLRQHTGQLLVIAYVVFCVWNFLFFLPMYSGMPMSNNDWLSRMWLPSWA